MNIKWTSRLTLVFAMTLATTLLTGCESQENSDISLDAGSERQTVLKPAMDGGDLETDHSAGAKTTAKQTRDQTRDLNELANLSRFTGVVQSVSDLVMLKSDEGIERAFAVDNQTTYLLDGNNATLADLRKSQRATITATGEEDALMATLIIAESENRVRTGKRHPNEN